MCLMPYLRTGSLVRAKVRRVNKRIAALRREANRVIGNGVSAKKDGGCAIYVPPFKILFGVIHRPPALLYFKLVPPCHILVSHAAKGGGDSAHIGIVGACPH